MKRTVTAFFIIFAVIFLAPFSKINAEETPVSDVAPPSDAPAPEGAPVPEGQQPIEAPNLTLSATDAEQSPYETFVTSPVNVQPSGNTGAAGTSIPIVVPPGRNGIAPNLALTYSSSGGNGHLGTGWSLDVGSIQRNTKMGICYDCNDYVASINGSASELVPRPDWNTYCSGGTAYGAKIEGGFTKYCKLLSGGWEVTIKNGTKHFYGTSAASRQDFDAGAKIFKWCFDKVEDTNGNYMEITYEKDDGDIYLKEIKYTGNGSSLVPSNSVKFEFDIVRTDNYPMYVPNYKVVTNRRLINIKTFANNGQQARRYELEYAYSTGTNRSLLKGVTLHGNNDTSTLPKISFTYQQGATGFSDVTYTSGEIKTGLNPIDGGVMAWVDFNGDGRADYCTITGDEGFRKLSCTIAVIDGYGNLGFASSPIESNVISIGYTNKTWVDFNADGKADYCRVLESHKLACTVANETGTGFGATYESAVLTGNWDYPYGRWMDFNGDGKADYCYLPDGKVHCVLSMGNNGFASGEIVSDHIPPQNIRHKTIRAADVNGDGRSDFCWVGDFGYLKSADEYVYDDRISCILSKGDGFGKIITKSIGRINEDKYPQWADVNGDGKSDACSGPNLNSCYSYPYDCRNRCELSTGEGFGDIYYYTSGITFADTGTQFTDFNGDGRADVCGVDKDSNRPKCFIIGRDVDEGQWYYAPVGTGGGEVDGGRQWADFNGDGKADYCRRSGNNVKCTIALSPSPAPIDDLLVGISNGIGGQTSVYYRPSSAYYNDYLPFIAQTVSSTTINDGNVNQSTANYHYAYGYFDPAAREFRGFEYLIAKGQSDAYGVRLHTETWFYTGYDPNHVITNEDIWKGFPSDQLVSDSSGKVYAWTANKYDVVSPYTNVSFPRLTQKEDYVFDGSAIRSDVNFETNWWQSKPYKLAVTSITAYDSFGNIKEKQYKHGETGQPAAVLDWTEKTNYKYETDSTYKSKWLVSLPEFVFVNDAAGTQKAKTTFTYFDSATGNLKSKTQWNDGGESPVTNYASYEYGNLKQVNDPKGNPSTVVYNSAANPYYVYPVRKINALGHTTETTYDERFGKPVAETDPNGCSSAYYYDAFGRITFVDNCGSSEPAFSWEEMYYDGLGRKIKTMGEGPDGKIIATETKYNARGLVDKTSLPYFADSNGNPLETLRWTFFEYDSLGRVTKVTNPDNTTQQKFYLRGRTTVVDANKHQKVEEKDIYGRLVKVEEYSGAYPSASFYATTTYNYDVLGNLIKVTDAQSNVTTINYNSLSQKANMTDPDMGTWYYTYDLNGNLKTQKDAKSQVITFEYDALNRVDWKRYPDATLIDYSYDNPHDESCPYGSNFKGRLTRVTDRSGESEFCYDSLGRVVKTIQTVDGTKYNTETTYDELGRTDRIKYPDSELVSYRYNGGFLEAVAIGAETHVRYSGYNAFGQPGTAGYGNGQNVVTTAYEYYSTNNRLKSIDTYGPSPLQDLAYQYDNVGNITSITDSIQSNRSQTFSYDHLDRLTQAYSSAYGTITYSYNQIGNMTYNSKVGSYAYGTKPHAVTSAGPYAYSYDTNGNMTSKNGVSIQYNYDNMPKAINGTTFVYDSSGQRVKKTYSGVATVYIGKLYECTSGTCTKYIFAGSNRVAMKTGSSVYYYHTDHLGSSSVMTNTSGNNVEELYYYPYGKTRVNSGTLNVKHKFTGQELDAETGLYNYGARYYDPEIGRFVSADSIVPDFSDPQSLNRYSYCRNNPVILTDPSGHFFWFAPIIAGAIVGGVSAGIQSDWDAGAMLEGAITGAITSTIGWGFGVGAGGELTGNVVGGATAGGLTSAAYGGNVGQGMMYGAIGSAAGYAAGGAVSGLGNEYAQFGAQVIAGGVISGTIAELSGGNFSQGFATGAIGAAVGYGIGTLDDNTQVKTGEESQIQGNYRLVVDNKDTLDKMGSLIEGTKKYMGILRATRNIDAVFGDIKYIAYNEARKLNYGCGDIVRATLFMNQVRHANNFVYYDYNGYMLGHGHFFTSSNYLMPIEVISHYGCDVHNPYFSSPVLRQGI